MRNLLFVSSVRLTYPLSVYTSNCFCSFSLKYYVISTYRYTHTYTLYSDLLCSVYSGPAVANQASNGEQGEHWKLIDGTEGRVGGVMEVEKIMETQSNHLQSQ